MEKWIRIIGAREHNLKNIDIQIPKNTFTVITGLSGSGKSTLALDTIYAEGQRRYLESVSTYARQFLGNLKKPDVELIEGLSPAIAIEQKSVSHNPRSTVGTITEIYDYIRVLFARVGKAFCPKCEIPLESSTVDEIVDNIYKNFKEDARLYIFAPIAKEKKGEFRKEISNMKISGFKRLEIDGELFDLDEVDSLTKTVRHTINLLVDRIKLRKDNFERIYEAVEIALKEGEGFVEIREVDKDEKVLSIQMFSENLACPKCGYSFPEINPKLFSFNSPYGACPECHGLGFKLEVEPDYIFDMNKSLEDGAAMNMGKDTFMVNMMKEVVRSYGEDPSKKLKDMPQKIINALLYGTNREIDFSFSKSNGESYEFTREFEGMVNWYERRYRETDSKEIKDWIENNFMIQKTCQTCKGKRLREEALSVKLNGYNIYDITEIPIGELKVFFETLHLSEFEMEIVRELLREIKRRLTFLVDVGLDYLTLGRNATTLSGGESQRVRLATQIGSGLTGVTYVLDEPTIGLHQRDNDKLIDTLEKLRDLDNTVIVVEHDENVIRSSDYIIDLGPGAGANGGRVIYQGPTNKLIENPGNSLTGKYLAGQKTIEILEKKRVEKNQSLKIIGASHNNLKNIDVEIPLGKFVVVTGVSGSGKSSLIMDTLYPALQKELYNSKTRPGKYQKIEGLEYIDSVISIDQSPIGRTPRSNPATYTGVFDFIREVFAQTPEAKIRGYDKGRFSFNVKGGRCEACKGHGVLKIEMQFLPDVYVTCDVCKGKRYNKETLKVTYKGKNISDVLDMTVDEALDFFRNLPAINNILQLLQDVGLGYIRLGQPATTLSGGEAQRIKLTSELRKKATGNTIYILDEPTTGLHFEDIKKLLKVLNLLVEKGNTVIVIEHELDIIKNADYIIDLGPDGGENGGRVVAIGTPEDIVESGTYTGYYLSKVLEKNVNKVVNK
ncbi:MAG: excinuclease ABC subunit UvrA [Defluviitoga tunisiensis]|jgi:excinuclease ABC subunit A|uniref:UvrABC system protein A n=1 Tax=Defluviitoga tunisiensis TaxID=1006576 RepID=A0A0C7NN96_DEFTU|nr:excinuclease ABC subunit UvrA [Defluviitoga tunisiensis]MDD3600779.1 excinuclease ABC subunit UvrA [Defluviitoga tunisiensis]MDY0379185.1 excinuclease ABC subunit UvrA [Defluviitoga tunisiensis]CEP77392.1 UvrABC system protein A [Defluviitoga tunisiensis]HOB55489.1 excinuclease ABC subunit UvrA [Defluviitoga tunisiensis]HOK16308.1 excinuclease ABC subunit UvrA [Defluviitoga tunisiensis]